MPPTDAGSAGRGHEGVPGPHVGVRTGQGGGDCRDVMAVVSAGRGHEGVPGPHVGVRPGQGGGDCRGITVAGAGRGHEGVPGPHVGVRPGQGGGDCRDVMAVVGAGRGHEGVPGPHVGVRPGQGGGDCRDVIVVGAGLAGSSMAAALAQRGWDVLLIERDRLPRHKVCGEFLSPEAQHSLARIGVLDDVAALAPIPLHGAAITTPGGGSVEMALPAAAWGLSRHALDASLAAAAMRCGAEFWPGTTVTSVTPSGGGSSVQVRRERQPFTLSARAVIFACGRHSAAALPPRDTIGGKRGWRHCAGLKRHYTGVNMEPRVELYLFGGGYVGINPIEGSAGEGRANVCVLITYAAFQALGKSLDGVLAAAGARHPALARRLQGAQPAPQSDCAVAPVDTERRPAPWDAQGGAPCLGDTAAMIPPLAGDGMAMALRSAELCLEPAHAFLTGALSLAQWEAAYTHAWRQEFGRRLRLGRALQSALTTPRLGDGLAGLGRHWPILAHLMLAGTRGRMA